MTFQTEKIINTIAGKNIVGGATKADVSQLIEHIWSLEEFLDEADCEDTFGTEGWRHAVGLDE